MGVWVLVIMLGSGHYGGAAVATIEIRGERDCQIAAYKINTAPSDFATKTAVCVEK